MGLAESSVSTRTVPRFTSAVTRGLRESAVIALGIVALVLFVALATYSPEDPGFSFTGTAAAIHNRIGVVGAWLADVLFFLFGRAAYLFAAVLAAAAVGMERRMKARGLAPWAHALGRPAPRHGGARAAPGAQGDVRDGEQEIRIPPVAAHRPAAPGVREERARRARAPGAAVRSPEGERAAAAQAPRRSAAARAAVFPRGTGSAVAPGGDEAQGFRHRRGGGGRAAGPGGHALRAASGAGGEGEPDHGARQGPGARAVGAVGARGGGHSGQERDGTRDRERKARDRDARGNRPLEGLRRAALAAHARARQGHQR